MNNVIVIVGPTGTGKSRLALTLAQKNNGILISADSRQVYKHADVGTNKTPLPEDEIKSLNKNDGMWEVNGIAIYGYDIVTPAEKFSVHDFVSFGSEIILQKSYNSPIYIVGGTGFYIDALLGLQPFSVTKPDNNLRDEYKNLSLEMVQDELVQLDPDGFSKLNQSDRNNKQRLIRFIELAREHGSIEKAKMYSPLKDTVSFQKIGLTQSSEIMHEQVNSWVDLICIGELQSEVEDLLARGYRKSALLTGIIYEPMVRCVDGTLELNEAKNVIKEQIRQYIKRQYTWFRRDSSTHWIDVSKEAFDHEVYKLLEFNTYES
ncbi:tRNA (adenosine(37)-N6)-dimethylallyltransferase MiaA [candidate division WWE3 bacterium]|uniref:tRNA dimethylallyltransferase n=1 Tax=candidate division WWE3 bacterium TaxID=2053526 RepID=A0A955LVZ9_UNCKA|nr:tRNA (adenosine(37)-N6)-dimethylallyltransferase MiaA [candidate division WWE3 bacterium]